MNLPLGSTHCHLYSSQECEKDGTKCGNTTEECDNKEAEIPSCYVLWKNETSSGGGVDVSENLGWAGGRFCVTDGRTCMTRLLQQLLHGQYSTLGLETNRCQKGLS